MNASWEPQGWKATTISTGLPPYSYQWDTDDGTTYTTDSIDLHSFPTDAAYEPCVSVTDDNGCTVTDCESVLNITDCNFEIVMTLDSGGVLHAELVNTSGDFVMPSLIDWDLSGDTTGYTSVNCFQISS